MIKFIKTIKNTIKLKKEMVNNEKRIDEFNTYYSDWCVNRWMSIDEFSIVNQCIDLAEKNRLEEGENKLFDYYENQMSEYFKRFINYHNRPFYKWKNLLELALQDYNERRYYSFILLLLSICDGVINDRYDHNFWSLRYSSKYTKDNSIDKTNGLKKLIDMMSQSTTKTNSDELLFPLRHGIIHGRELNYNNRQTALKLFSILIALETFLHGF
jgi:hypothetical protein